MADRGVVGVGLSVSYAAERLADLPATLDRFEALGLDSVELFLPAFGVVAGGRVRPTALAVLRAACAGRPFAITLHGPLAANFGVRAQRALQLDVCRAGLEVAAAVGARALVHHSSVILDNGPAAAADAMAAEAEALIEVAADAAASGAALAVETMHARAGEWTASPAELARTLAAVGSPAVGATVDFSHAWLNCRARGLDYLAEMAALAPHARHMHLHDSFGQPTAFRPWSRGDAIMFGFGDLHLPPGAGTVPWAALASLPWGGPALATLELDPRWEHEWAEAIAWARGWIDACQAAAAPARTGSPRRRAAL